MTRSKSIKEHLFRSIEVREEDECWPWTKSKVEGYGKFQFQGHFYLSHRTMYELYKGPIPKGLDVMHLCNNRGCCNPKHLLSASRRENMLYAVATGTHYTGVRNALIVMGVHFNRYKNLWTARVGIGGRKKVLYEGKDFFEACCRRKAWDAEVSHRGGIIE